MVLSDSLDNSYKWYLGHQLRFVEASALLPLSPPLPLSRSRLVAGQAGRWKMVCWLALLQKYLRLLFLSLWQVQLAP